jgi:trimeric autotransporter adhesin
MRKFLLLLAVIVSSLSIVTAQTTLTTLPNPPYNASNGAGTNTAVTFVIENTNGFPIVLNGVSTWLNTADANSNLQLWYSATDLSGAPTIATPAWTMINQVTNFPAPATSGITPVWTSLGFIIPANTQYRFAVWYVNIGSHYSGTGVGTVTPSTFSGGGVNLKVGDVQIAGSYVGYGGANNPRWWTGAVTFQPSGPCVNPPTAGTVTASSNPVCSGSSFNLSTSGGTGGTGQTYQWETAPAAAGPWTPVPGPAGTSATLTTSQTSNTYYRVTVTCGAGSATTAPLLVNTTICYCPSIPTSTIDEEIFSITVNGATNALNCTTVAPGPGSILNRYSNFYPNGSLTTIMPGSSIPFTIVEDECDGATYYNNGISMWIDFNRDGDFDDPGEQVYVEGAVSQSPRTVTGSFTVPPGATPGLTGMRIIVAENFSGAGLTPCMTYTYGETEDYLVTIGTPGPCTNPPTTGTVIASANPTCLGTPFSLYTSGGSFGSGQTYQWQSSPDNVSWTNIAGATASSLSTSQTTNTYYRIQVTCGVTVSSASLLVTTQPCYCTSIPTSIADEEIFSVTVNGATNGLNCTTVAPGPGSILNRYSNFYPNGSLTTIMPGASVPFTIVEDECDGATYYNNGISMWIDFNRDGDFLDPGEQVYVEGALSQSPRTVTGSFTVPTGATPGLTGMRIIVAENLSGTGLTPCMTYTYGETEDYLITIGTPGPCTNPPTTGTVTASANPVCINAPFSLFASGGSFGTGQTYQWQSSPDNVNWTNVAGATSSSLTTSQTTNTYYRLQVTCGVTVSSASLLVTSQLCYCTSIPTSTIDEEIFSVTLNGSTNAYNCTTVAPGPGSILNRYSNFTTLGPLTTLIPGTSVPFTIEEDECDGPTYYNNGIAIWIDFNRDGDYTDAGEQVYVEAATSQSPRTVTGNIAIPIGATPGITGMRIIVAENFSGTGLTPCMTYTYGETEDYYVNIIPPIPCAGIPTGGTTTTTKSAVCLGEQFTLNTTGTTQAVGLTYQWQSSPDGITWTNIAGATNLSLTTSQSVTTQYRLSVTCTNPGGGTGYASPVTVTSPLLVSGTFTINSAVPTGGTNFNSFNDAYNYIKCGINGPVIFNVDAASGPYTEQLIMNAVPGASATNTVTFNGNGRTITFNTTSTAQNAVIKLDNADYIKFDNLVITTTGASNGFGVQLINNADFNTISNCTINVNATATGTGFAGIVISSSHTSATTTGSALCDNNIFSGNTINGGYYGITQVGSSTVANGSNQILNNDIRNFYMYGIYVMGSFNTQITGNTISRPTRATVSTFYGIYFTGLSASAQVDKNRITNPFGGATTSTSAAYGIYFTGVDALAGIENVVINNLISGFNNSGDQYGFYNTSSDNVWYFHNTVALDHAASTATATYVTRGFYQTTQADGIVLFDNIITISRGGASVKHVLYFNTAGSDILSDRNDLYISSTGGTNNIGYVNAVDYALLTTWRTTGDDLNSVSIDPIYFDPSTNNYKPTNATLNDRGLYVDVPDDILNVLRNTTAPDMGAYEFTPPPCTAPPVAGTATVSQSPICYNYPVQLSVTGASNGLTQTYQWQSAPAAAGPWTNYGTAMFAPDTTFNATTTLYFRLGITCGVSTTYSTSVLLTVTPALPGGTYTIGGPAGPTNYANFNAAKAAMACGITGPVVFNVVPGSGPYLEQLVLDTIAGVSAINTVTFNGNGNTIKFAAANSNTNERAVIKLNTTDYITFDSLIIDASPIGTGTTYGYGVQLINNADNNTFRKCTINTTATSSSTNYAGIVISASETSATTAGFNSRCDNNVFDSNTINGGYYGATIVGGTAAADPRIDGNKFTNNTVKNFYTYGVYIAGTTNTLIEGNDISRPTRTATSPSTITTFNGIYVTGVSQRLRISKNRIHNSFGGVPTNTSAQYAIYITGSDATSGSENKVTNNLVYDMNGEGVVYGFYNSSSDYALYYHNTISLDKTTSTSTSTTRAFYQITAATGIQFRNNIISIKRGGTGEKHAMYFATTTSEIYSDRNDFYINAGGTQNHIGYYTTNRTTLADWQAATLQDGNSKTVDPDYTNPGAGDYKPSFGAALIDNLGTNVGVTTDILDLPRSATTPDPGAYEFNIPPCVDPPTAGTTVAIPNTLICMGTPIALSLSGNSVGAGQTYQWQYATSAAGPWTNLDGPQTSPVKTTPATFSLFYRAAIQCNGGTVVYSTPVQVTLNPPLAAGTYTIDPSLPASPTNFIDFTSAVDKLYCGIAGHIIFNAAPVAFNEQIRIGVVPGTSPTATVTFQTNPASVTNATLQFAGTATDNYVLKYDSVQYIFFKRISINAQNNTNGRAVEFAKTASNDSLVNCVISVPPTAATGTAIIGVYADQLTGGNNTIKGNTISGGSAGVYFAGVAAGSLTSGNNIEGNTVTGTYQYGIYTNFTDRSKVNKNTVTMNGTLSTTAYGIYVNNADTGFQVAENNVTLSNTTTAMYGIYVNASDATTAEPAKIANNKITAAPNNTGNLWGLAIATSSYADIVNNVVSVSTTGATSYGLWSNMDFQNKYYNNSVNSTSTSTGAANVAAYFNHTSGASGNVNIRNNIFSHKAGGRAMQLTNANYIYSDYNMLYTTGTNLVIVGAVNYPTLAAFQNAWTWDVNSITYNPAFVSNTDLRPDLASPDVWAIHGRGVQIVTNTYDFNNNPRPTTLTTGVPDLGAYEFLPTSTPVALTAIPAAPVANSTQRFMLGTDTVIKINWGATVPPSITARRYSGVLPPALPAGARSMYFYTDIDVPGTNNYPYSIQQYYIDPWQGFIPVENQTKLGRTDASNNWIVNTASTVQPLINYISESNLTFLDKYTGMADPTAPPPPPIYVQTGDSSNRGKDFWVPYGHHQFFETTNTQQMVLYLSAEQAANVTVNIAGTAWTKSYSIPANTVISSDIIPKTGIYDGRILTEGLFTRGIHITSDVPIVAYAHIYGSASSGATMLMPVAVYGYEYYGLTSRQNYATNTFSWINVVAAYDSTVVQITPSVPTRGGRPAGVPFTVNLNKGDVYQVMGALISGSEGYDVTGTKVKSISNVNGKCFPIAVFSGSSRTGLGCGSSAGSSGDNAIQQNFPSQAWGTKYLTAPTSNGASASSLMTNIYRVAVKDPTTVVKRNGVVLTGLQNNYFYQFESNTADYIESDVPVMVAQYMSSSGSCPNTGGDGDPEMMYISPIEQAIKKVGFYRTNNESIDENYLTLVIPTAGLASLTINGSSTFDYTYAHPNRPGYTVVVKRWVAAPAQVLVQSDSAFTAITYGLGSVESYGYNAGTLVKNLLATSNIQNTLATPGVTAPFTCPNAPFLFTAILAVKPTQLVWNFSAMPNLSPNVDITQNNPVPVDSFLVNGRWFYKFTLPGTYTFNTTGRFLVPIHFTHPSVENCNNTQEATITVDVIPGPVADYTFTPIAPCFGDVVQFNSAATSGTFTINRWQWNFGDATTSNLQNPTKVWAAPNTYPVSLRMISPEGCFGDVSKNITINPLPIAAVATDSFAICAGQTATFNATAVTGGIYKWYTTPTGGAPVFTGTPFTTPTLSTTAVYYLEVTNGGGCTSVPRKRVVAQVFNKLATPVVSIDTVGVFMVRWKWNAVPGATGYEVQNPGTSTWITPSSGATGLTHTVSLLRPTTNYQLKVRALGTIACQTSDAASKDTITLTDIIFIPNTFTPNGDGKNDMWRVYGNVVLSGEMMVFNQWGEKIFETKNITTGWDGRYKGKVQPVGVYVYVVKLVLENGEQQTRKGVINLVR